MSKNVWRNGITKNYFTKKPLNYEVYVDRLKQFNKLAITPTNTILKDCILAGRTLQKESYLFNRNIPVNNLLLGIDLLKSNSEVESKIWKFLMQHRSAFINDDDIIRTYIHTKPRPSNISNQFDIVVSNFKKSIGKSKLQKSPVKLFLAILLGNKDYYNCFKLVDLTYASTEYLDFKKRELNRNVVLMTSLAGIVSFLESFYMPLVPCTYWIALNLGILGTFCWGYMKLHLTPNLDRVSWRPHNTLLHNYQHQEVIITINKIITHFEEHNEVNIKNYHHSEVRALSGLNIFESNDYILELPQSNQLAHRETLETDRETKRLWRFFRLQLQKRRMVLNDLAEELMFLEFWLTQGENFEWVEPDQDPAEILNLKIAHDH